MSNSSYTLLKNSTDKSDVGIPMKESGSSSTMANSNEALKKRYMQIASAVALYWYRISFNTFDFFAKFLI
jgi:hypothetical protein